MVARSAPMTLAATFFASAVGENRRRLGCTFMHRKILLRGARQLLTLRGPSGPRFGTQMQDVGSIENGALLIEDGVIRNVGPARRVDNLGAARDAIELNANGRVVMPGFVDCRTTLISGPPLLQEFEARLGGRSAHGCEEESLIRAVRASSRPLLEILARKALREFIRHGTTTLDAHTGLGLDDKTEMKILRALNSTRRQPLDIEPTFFGASRLPPDFADPWSVYLDRLTSKTLPKVKHLNLSTTVDVRTGPAGFSAEAAGAYLKRVAEIGFRTRVTASEIVPDKGVQLAVEASATSVDHLEHISQSDIRLLSEAGLMATVLPGVSYHRLTGRYAPAREMIDAGCAVALATGYSSDRCPTCSMPAILSLACTQMRMLPSEAIVAGTVNAAHVLRVGGRIGTLETGMEADLIMLNVADYREIPYHFGMNMVAMTMKRGDVIYPRMELPWSS